MAGCYHDKQDFKSDLKIEIAKEGDILEAGQDLKDIKCNKNPGHRDFIPFKDLTLEHLPHERRNRETLDKIKEMGSSIVRLVVGKMKNSKRIKEAGSGCVFKHNNEYFIRTNNHVVKTNKDVENCTVEFHYDDDSRSNILTSRGVKLIKTCPDRDVTLFTFHPVPDFLHQLDLMYKSPSIVMMYKDNKIVTLDITLIPILSQIKSFLGLDLNCSLITCMYVSFPDGSISYLKSSYFKFQPIPSNIHQLTSIEVHIDEDDGNSRVIPGDVITFGDEFVVKISESIFQDEVKKCRLVWNGEVIGCGTRLYFQQVKCSDIYSGIDLELQMKKGRDNYWLFEFHPIPRYTEGTSNVCCIGHPHGGFKVVTFGLYWGESLQRFDNLGRRITQPNKDCKCTEVNCLKYTCKTCPGSSGSPVFPLNEWMDWSSSFCHFMGEKAQEFFDGELVENINVAWSP